MLGLLEKGNELFMRPTNLISMTAAAVCITVVILGCGGGRTQVCRGEIAFGGRNFRGVAGDEKRAKMDTCTKYCIEGDPAVGKVYMNWAKSQTDPEKIEMSIYDAMTVEKTIADAIKSCEPRCLSDVEGGRLKMEVTCNER